MRGVRTRAAGAITSLLLAACGGADDLVQLDDPGEASAPVLTPSDSAAPVPADVDAPAGGTGATTSLPAPARSALLSFTGDTLAHSPLWRQAQRNSGGDGYDFFPMFADVADVLTAADLAICHLETPIAPEGEEFTTDPLYGVPPQIATAMARAGYDRCSTASNHILDRYARGVDRTIDVLEQNGIGQSGSARTESESLPFVFEVNGIAMSHLSYTYATNGIPLPDGEPWRTNLLDPARIVRDAQVARDLGAEVVIASLHWGTEKVTEPNEQQITVANEVTASGAVDLIVGHHAHVVQPIAQVNGVWVAYGIGNILSNLPVNDAWPEASQDAVILEVDIRIATNGTVAVAPPIVRPTWVDNDDGWVIRDVDAMLGRGDLTEGQRSLLEQSRTRTADVLGEFFPPP